MPFINIARCAERNQPTALISTACSSSSAGKGVEYMFSVPGADDHSYIIINNSGSKAITAKMSDGYMGAKNKAYSIPAGKIAVIPIESGTSAAKNGNIGITVAPAEPSASLTECQVSVAGFVSGFPTN